MADTRKMVKDWIQYLKNNQIVVGSDPSTGDLNYKRPVTTDDLFDFIGDDADYDAIEAAIEQVKGTSPPTPAETEPAPVAPTPPGSKTNKPKVKYVPQGAANTGTTPSGKTKPRVKYIPPNRVTEAIKASTTQLSEDDVLAIFNILASPRPPPPPDPDPEKKINELNRIKRIIRDNMTDQQRKSLWRALNHV